MPRSINECEPDQHRFFALEPFQKEYTGLTTILTVCTQCGKPMRYDLDLDKIEPIQITE
jgi:hypothetical protein